MLERQLYACVVMSLCLLLLIVKLVQEGRLDIAYCWLWLCIGGSTLILVLRNDLLKLISRTIGAVDDTTTVFLLGSFLIVLMCLQFSLVISHHRRQIKKLLQRLAILAEEVELLKKGREDASDDA